MERRVCLSVTVCGGSMERRVCLSVTVSGGECGEKGVP